MLSDSARSVPQPDEAAPFLATRSRPCITSFLSPHAKAEMLCGWEWESQVGRSAALVITWWQDKFMLTEALEPQLPRELALSDRDHLVSADHGM